IMGENIGQKPYCVKYVIAAQVVISVFIRYGHTSPIRRGHGPTTARTKDRAAHVLGRRRPRSQSLHAGALAAATPSRKRRRSAASIEFPNRSHGPRTQHDTAAHPDDERV